MSCVNNVLPVYMWPSPEKIPEGLCLRPVQVDTVHFSPEATETNGFSCVSSSLNRTAVIEMMKGDFSEVFDFAKMYMTALMSDPYSILYFEIQQNQNTSTLSGYEFPSSNGLLYFLCGTAENVRRLGVSTPVGDFLLTGPASPMKEENRIFFNREMADFQRNEQWKHPWFVGIRLYDLTVTAALFQNVQWHMELYDFMHLTEALLHANDEKAPNINLDAEFPTVGHYLIYEMFSAMRGWIWNVRYLPADQENIRLENQKFDHENGNIPKSTIMVMVICLNKVITADNITDRFKRYILRIVLSAYESTRYKNTSLQKCGYDEMMLNAITAGDFWKDPDVPVYRRKLLQLLPQMDIALKPEAKTVRDALREAVAEEG